MGQPLAPIAVSMGCPAGIGPEIICKMAVRKKNGPASYAVIGKADILRQAAAELRLALDIVPWRPGSPIAAGTLPVFEVDAPCAVPVQWGRPSLEDGRLMARSIEEAVRLVREGACAALVTCPISKKQLHAAGYPYPGHTEMLAALSGTGKVWMMMAGHRLKVVLVTIHEPLRRVSGLLGQEEIRACIAQTGATLQRDFALPCPRIAVAALNPHAGEEGLFGDEEGRLIAPALSTYTGPGTVSGPWPPDTVFYQAAAGKFDAVVAMYHDQGLIPFKLLHFKDGVNVTLGLPFIRTSVDHGTAYDIAGRDLADPASLMAALDMAQDMALNQRHAL